MRCATTAAVVWIHVFAQALSSALGRAYFEGSNLWRRPCLFSPPTLAGNMFRETQLAIPQRLKTKSPACRWTSHLGVNRSVCNSSIYTNCHVSLARPAIPFSPYWHRCNIVEVHPHTKLVHVFKILTKISCHLYCVLLGRVSLPITFVYC